MRWPWSRRGPDASDPPAREARRRPHPVTKIERPVLQLILEAAKDAYPMEFAGALRAEGDTITEIILVPGTVNGAAHAIMRINDLPIDRSIVGVAHSHPSPNATPSSADLHLFSKFGHTHIIAAVPFSLESWIAWDHRGDVIRLKVV